MARPRKSEETEGGEVEATRLTRYYGAHAALRDVSFRVEPGEVVGVLGLNGAGKSTLLQMLVGALRASGGQLRIDGHEAHTRAARARVGFLPDRPPLFDELDVRAYVRVAARLRGVTDVDARVRAVLEQLDLGAVAREPIATLSHGYQQRVGLAQALVHRPRVVVLDEPIQGLDPMQIAELRARIPTLEGRPTVFLSTHILGEIAKTCDRLLVLHEGRLAATGSYAELVGGARHVHVETGPAEEPTLRAALEEFPGAELARWEDGWRVRVALERDARARLARALVDAGVPLIELRTEADALEDLFRAFDRGGAA